MAERLTAPGKKGAKKKGAGKKERAPRGLDKKGVEAKSQVPDQPSAQANTGNRKKLIRQIFKDLDVLDTRAESLREERRELMAQVKGDLDMKVADFNVARRFYQLEGEDRDLLFDTLRECFDSMGIGGQLDFLDAVEKDDERRTEAAQPRATVTKGVSTEETIAKAKALAQADSDKGKTAFNPYEDGTPEALAYSAAYTTAQKKLAMQFGEQQPATRA